MTAEAARGSCTLASWPPYPDIIARHASAVALNEDAARTVLLLKAIEDSDPHEALLPRADRHLATREAHPPEPGAAPAGAARLTPDEESFLARRARLLMRSVETRIPALTAAHSAVRWRGWLAWTLAAASFALGMAANELGASRHVNILSFPLLGMLAWNAAVYLLLLIRTFRGWTARGRVDERPRGPWVRLASSALVRATGANAREAADPVLAAGVRAYVAQWSALAAPLYAMRARRVLHLCAALLAAGAVLGLYLRGLVFEYRAGWESTFLDAQAVHAILHVILGPASAATGVGLPDAAGIAALRWTGSGSGENAARWIHLYAATALAFIVLPRLALALRAGYAELRLRSNFPLPADVAQYCRAVLAARHVHQRTALADVVACNYTLSSRALRVLEDRLSASTGARVAATLRASVRYGEEEDHVRALAEQTGQPAEYTVLVFNAGATPEEENHGVLLHAYRSAAKTPPIVVLDESAYRQRLAGQAGAAARLAERRAAWETFARAHGVEPVVLDLDPAVGAART